jgi:uncharacterized damage-inducible protein DinB
MTTSETLLRQFDPEMVSTRKILECVPGDRFAWKPHEKSMTLGRLASHVAEMPQWAFMTVNLDKLDLAPDSKGFLASSEAELMEAFDNNVSGAREAIAGASEEHLEKNWSLLFQGAQILSMPRIYILRNTVISHLIHHRGQLSVYLRLLDVPIPGMYGPSADGK